MGANFTGVTLEVFNTKRIRTLKDASLPEEMKPYGTKYQ
jgi:hypothetical protein